METITVALISNQ